MRAALSIMLAALLLAQATFGLCWHEVDGCANCSSRPAVCSDQCGCDKEVDDQTSGQPTEPARGRLECRGFCTYLPTQTTEVDTQDQSTFDLVADIAALVDGKLSSPPSWKHLGAAIDHAPPLRLHLLHQLLLI